MANFVKNFLKNAKTIIRRIEVITIKLKVKSLLLIFKNVEESKEDMNPEVYHELYYWAQKNNIKVQIVKREEPIKIVGQHLVYELKDIRHYEVMVFSK